MSARAEHRRRERARGPEPFRPDDDVAVVPAWAATEADLPEARRRAHDTLLALLGERRRGPVHWSWWSGADAFQALRVLAEDTPTAEHADNYRRLRAHLREYGGYLVVAMAKGQP